MTDARYPERWLNDVRLLRLSDAAHRLFVYGLVWSAANRTDGELLEDDLRLMPGIDTQCAGELVAAKLWATTATGWRIVDFELTQTTREQLEANERARVQNRNRQRRHRQRKAANPVGAGSRDMSVRDGEHNVTRDKTHNNTGQARTGQDRRQEAGESHSEDDGHVAALNGHRHKRDERLTMSAQRKWEAGYDD